MEEQDAATQEISRNVQQAQGNQQVSSNITDVQRDGFSVSAGPIGGADALGRQQS